MKQIQKTTGYPSIDKPWMKYYSEEALYGEIPKCTMYEYIFDHNKSHLDGIALRYFTKKITYQKLFENIRKTAGTGNPKRGCCYDYVT